MIGGSWNEGDTLADSVVSFLKSPNKLLIFKAGSCSTENAKGCRCAVPQEYIDKYTPSGVLEMAGLISAYSKLQTASDETLLKVIRALEDPGIAGEMYSSAASFDPTFWPLHGSAERLVGLKRAKVSSGDITSFDETWNYPSSNANTMSSAAYLNGVCDWSGVNGTSDLTFPTCSSNVWCSGHYSTDVLEFGNFLNQGETYTNAEMYAFMHPWTADLPYTYDTFDYDYCTEKGYDMMDYTSSSKTTSFTSYRESRDSTTSGMRLKKK
eukprot:gene35205-43401_t